MATPSNLSGHSANTLSGTYVWLLWSSAVPHHHQLPIGIWPRSVSRLQARLLNHWIEVPTSYTRIFRLERQTDIASSTGHCQAGNDLVRLVSGGLAGAHLCKSSEVRSRINIVRLAARNPCLIPVSPAPASVFCLLSFLRHRGCKFFFQRGHPVPLKVELAVPAGSFGVRARMACRLKVSTAIAAMIHNLEVFVVGQCCTFMHLQTAEALQKSRQHSSVGFFDSSRQQADSGPRGLGRRAPLNRDALLS